MADSCNKYFNSLNKREQEIITNLIHNYKEYVYIDYRNNNEYIKIGKTNQDIKKYTKYLSDKLEEDMTVVMIEVKNNTQVEKIMHLLHSEQNVKRKIRFGNQREWFIFEGNKQENINNLVDEIKCVNQECVKCIDNFGSIITYTHYGNYEKEDNENNICSDDDIYSDGDNSDWSDASDTDSDYELSDTESEPDEI